MEDWLGILGTNLFGCLVALAILIVFIIVLIKFFLPLFIFIMLLVILASVLDQRERFYNDYKNRRDS